MCVCVWRMYVVYLCIFVFLFLLDGELLLASCSQDCLIRVWRLVVKCDAPSEPAEGIIRMKEDMFEVKGKSEAFSYSLCVLLNAISLRLICSFCPSVYAVSLETVLAGHENWVYGIHWQPSFRKGIRTNVSQLTVIAVNLQSI